MDVLVKMNSQEYHAEIMKLQAAIKHGQGDVASARTMIEECPADDIDTIINTVWRREEVDQSSHTPKSHSPTSGLPVCVGGTL